MPRKAKIKDNIKWEKPACDNCKSKEYKVFLDNITTWEHDYKFREVKCKKCGLVFLSPRPKREYISKFYLPKTYWGTDLTLGKKTDDDTRNNQSSYNRVYKNILSLKRKGAIFDVGLGTGSFLSYFNKLGWKAGGVELSNDAVNYARRVYKLKNIQTESFDNVKVRGGSYDVITFNSSLEHLYSPENALRKAYSILKTSGVIVVTVPNLDSLGFKIFGKYWLGLHPPKHLYHFTQDSLSAILRKVGFNIEKVDHWYWTHSYYSFFESFRYMTSPRFKNPSDNIEEIYENLSISDNRKNVSNIIIKKVGIIFAKFFAVSLSIIGSSIVHGEVITIYARKH